MKAPRTKWIPISEAKVDTVYEGYKLENEPNTVHFGSILYKGNGVGWLWEDENQKVEGILSLERRLTWQEKEEWYKEKFDLTDPINTTNLYGLFTDMYSVGDAYHEMWNGWIDCNWYEMSAGLYNEDFILIGIAPAPYQWTLDDECVAFVAEYKDSGARFWCHGGKRWLDGMREQMAKIYEQLPH